ncbi:MAG: hypothetical protein II702_06505 [Clostridia bacterium]|nr:hypothetical protein [Clostridia bacterium]
MKRILVAALSLALIICMVSGMTGCGAKKGEDLTTSPVSERTHAETPEDTTAEETVTETQTVTETETTSVTTTRNLTTTQASLWQKAQMAYLMEIESLKAENEGGRNTDTASFILYDIDNNGIPELFLYCGYKTNMHGDGYRVYTYSENGLIKLGNIDNSAIDFYDDTPGDGDFKVLFLYHYSMAKSSFKVQNNSLVETTIEGYHQYDPDGEEIDNALEDAEKHLMFQASDMIDVNDAGTYFLNL